ncbi:FAD-linked oxidoreductase-like protein [Tricharina praecox]|uniref:FAD-linked oxidoreductase-like protein n=1 Tax=Tricharina praecox TaxID=43433 RepID=UPI00221EE5FD|nr:FAD-linked oxidoreductase-like protein [Tricharina praecox]KAI5842776.1 FAD-linked oxidoreductase-like protein [Tricharina praecox]
MHSHSLPTAATPPPPPTSRDTGPLARLPTASLVRSLLLHTITSSPTLLALGTKVMLATADNIDRIPPLKWVVDKTFYAHFCAGSTPTEISRTVSSLRSLGYSGLILAYAREVSSPSSPSPTSTSADIASWLSGTLTTISLSTPGDFVALKFSGAGPSILPLLSSSQPCTTIPALATALDTICAAARARGIALLIDAEHAALQRGVDAWAVGMMRRYNTSPTGAAVVFNTYQMYLRRAPGVLAAHVALAEREGWRLGVKLVRGAYLGSDPRAGMWGTKAETDHAYDAALEQLMRKGVDTVVASHNRRSVECALKLRADVDAQGKGGRGLLVFAQLMGMADELSLSLVGRAPVLKYAVWGTTGECVKYLLRRAEENKDAVGRSGENYKAVVGELRRRVGF